MTSDFLTTSCSPAPPYQIEFEGSFVPIPGSISVIPACLGGDYCHLPHLGVPGLFTFVITTIDVASIWQSTTAIHNPQVLQEFSTGSTSFGCLTFSPPFF